MMFTEGNIVAGKFRIDRVLGQGGMGVVVAATHLHLGQRVALKFLLPELGSNATIVGRFVREARASAQLRGEHACHVSDVGTLESGAPYIVMELLDGRDLASVLAESGPLPVPVVVDYLVQVCSGLAEAHAARIVHRDLKPANLFLTRRPEGTPLIKIVDFGIAKAPSDANFRLTITTAVMGSPGYMPPEQLRSSRDADVRSDIWALGVILYELSSGRQPFTAETITELALRVAMDATPPLAGPGIPRGFDRVVYRCLEKDPAKRFQDVAQLATALAPFGGPRPREQAAHVGRILSATPPTPVASSPRVAAAAPTTLGSSASDLQAHRADGPRWGILVGALAVATLAVVGFLELRGDAQVAAVAAPPAAPAAMVINASPADAAQADSPAARASTVRLDAGSPAADAAAAGDATPAIDATLPRDATMRSNPLPHSATQTKAATAGSAEVDLGNSRL